MDCDIAGERVAWAGGADAGYARMILHYAHLCAAAGGVDGFLIGSELRGLTTLRSDAATYPAVAALAGLAAADPQSPRPDRSTTTQPRL
nr:glycoside hydrolase TIM-barrel-like domain-containing protein [Amaricoccus solimangrovi]